ncbi:hypothetical protein [Shewanella halifaxensis]|nr:hypothetical protein [Shewanella halifaxensis]
MAASASENVQNDDMRSAELLSAAVQTESQNSAVVDITSLKSSGLTTDLTKSIPLTLQDKQARQTDKNGSEYAPLVSQRFISFAQHDLLQTRPDYLLAFEFTSPAVPSLTVGYRIDFTPAVDWSLHIESASHRLCAWKESNLLYRFSQARSLS